MTLGSTIKNFVTSLMLSARIVSPRFTDYKIEQVEYYSEAEGFEDVIRAEVKRIMEEEKSTEGRIEDSEGTGGGLTESGAANMTRKGLNIAQHPEAMVGMGISYLPHAALVALAIALVPLIIKELKKPGSALDIRFRRIMIDEFNAFLGRQDQWDTKLGLREVRVQSSAGFLIMNGSAMTENNLRQVREGGTDGDRLALIGMTDHAKELFR